MNPVLLGDLSITLSRQLAGALPEGTGAAITTFLDGVAAATGVDNCRFLDFTESASEPRLHDRTRPEIAAAAPARAAVPSAWIVERLARGEVVGMDRVGRCDHLGVPVSIAGRVVCALLIDGTPLAQFWPPSFVDRLRVLLEIIGAALLQVRTEKALRSNVAAIEKLNDRLAADNVYLKEELKSYHDFDDIVGESAPLRVALARVAQVATANSNVLLLGPTGTGKELFARAIHERSRRHARPLVRVNCAALPPTLIESELFGHEKGAFTGAIGTRQGRFELADGGTIFLDEIGDLPRDIQVKFLRVLQEGEFERVGSSHTRKVDVRVIAATHRDLEAAVADGSFRADLYYRLSVYPIRLPSLQERIDDIPRLVWFFIHRHQRNLGRNITKVPQSVMETLQRHSWPGNIRELENLVERAMIASSGETLHLDDAVTVGNPELSAAERDTLDAVQRAHIRAMLHRCGWRISGRGNAAERLGLHPNTLRFRMKKLGVAVR